MKATMDPSRCRVVLRVEACLLLTQSKPTLEEGGLPDVSVFLESMLEA